MRHTSRKRAKLQRVWGPIRAAFVMETNFCWVCGRTWNLCVHELARGAFRAAAFVERKTWVVACGECNCGPLNDHAEWPLARQLALKYIYDREHFDLAGFNRLRDREPDAITFDQVELWLRGIGEFE